MPVLSTEDRGQAIWYMEFGRTVRTLLNCFVCPQQQYQFCIDATDRLAVSKIAGGQVVQR